MGVSTVRIFWSWCDLGLKEGKKGRNGKQWVAGKSLLDPKLLCFGSLVEDAGFVGVSTLGTYVLYSVTMGSPRKRSADRAAGERISAESDSCFFFCLYYQLPPESNTQYWPVPVPVPAPGA